MSRPIALVDLDDSLFQSRRKCPPTWASDDLHPLAFDRDGGPLSFATPPQRAFLDWLLATALVVPVTARSREALSRVQLQPGVAVCSHGGLVLDADGAPDAAWTARMVSESRAHAAALDVLARQAQAVAAEVGSVRVRVLAEDGLDLYLLLKPVEHDETGLSRAVDRLRPITPEGWTVHRNGSNAAFLPPHLGKAQAVAHLLPQLRDGDPRRPVIGLGDSFTDAGFMALCDYAMTPTGSQLAGRLLQDAAT